MTTPFDDDVLAQFRSQNITWGVDTSNVLVLTVPAGQSVRKAVNIVMKALPKAAVITMEKHGARIQL